MQTVSGGLAMALRPCLGASGQHCGKLTSNTRCPDCARIHERTRRQRPTTTARGYDARHRQLRQALQPHVDAGTVRCWRCTHLIQPGEPWDLGHDDQDRTRYRGPEHSYCNRSSAAIRGNQQRATGRHSRDWLT